MGGSVGQARPAQQESVLFSGSFAEQLREGFPEALSKGYLEIQSLMVIITMMIVHMKCGRASAS
jgi:hypothetical protein